MEAVNALLAMGSCANNDIKRSHRICYKCAKIPWDTLFGPEIRLEPEIDVWDDLVFHRSKVDQKAECRICRFFAKVLKDCVLGTKNGRRFEITPHYAAGLGLDLPSAFLEVDHSAPEHADHFGGIVLACQPTSQVTREVLEKAFSGYAIPKDLPTVKKPLLDTGQTLYPAGVNAALLKSWLDICIEKHGHQCRPRPTDGLKDLEVIDCEHRRVVPAPPACRYAALSYVWGQEGKKVGSTNTREMIPKTVEDAIETTLLLGYRYLWVDRYCIDQSDAHAKQHQIMQMADIYAAAHFTIFAAAGNDSNHGLPGVRPHSRGFSSYCASTRSVRLYHLPQTSPSWNLRKLSSSSWASRAWTFQECYFSKRRLFFTDRQVIFICGTDSYYEGDRPHGGGGPSEDAHRELPGWFANTAKPEAAATMIASMEVLRQYSARKLSFEADALNAITGAMNSYARYGVQHIWGVPWKRSSADYSPGLKDFLSTSRSVRRDIDIALLWNHDEPGMRREGFPSWSPLGWKNPIRWYFRSIRGRSTYVSPEAKIVQVKSNKDFHKLYAPANPDEYTPEELSQYLKVEARTAMCNFQSATQGKGYGKKQSGIEIPLGHGWNAIAEVYWDLPPDKGSETLLKCVLLPGAEFAKSTVDKLHAHVLILEQHGNHYKRIGITRLPANFGEHCDNRNTPTFGLVNKFNRIFGPQFREGSPYYAETEIPSTAMPDFCWWDHFQPETIILG